MVVDRPNLSLTEWVVLALMGERPSHGFAVGRQLEPGTDLGRVLTVHRPLVYRALDRLAAAGLVKAHHTEPGLAGPDRTIYEITAPGRRALSAWLATPVQHVRDLRIELLVKLRLLARAGGDPLPLIQAQRAALGDTLDALARLPDGSDEVDLWRHHNARAAAAFLEHLEARPVGELTPRRA
jgi:PadR family transcriptional regulator AphA